MTAPRSVFLSASDNARIQSILEKTDPKIVGPLLDEIDSATILPDDELPANVVNMGSEVIFRDLDSGKSSRCTLVFPHQADAANDRVSVLAPVGAALIGLSVGETIAWPVPGGKLRRLRVVDVEQHSDHARQA